MHDIGLGCIAIMHIGHVPQVNHGAIDRLDWDIGQVFYLSGSIIQVDGVFQAANLLGANRRDNILSRQRSCNVLRT